MYAVISWEKINILSTISILAQRHDNCLATLHGISQRCMTSDQRREAVMAETLVALCGIIAYKKWGHFSH